MAINFVKMFDPEAVDDPRTAYKQKMALAQSLMKSDTGAVYSTGAGLAKVAEKAAGGWLARMIQDEENKANSEAGSMLANALLNWGGAASSAGQPAAGGAAPTPTEAPFKTSIGPSVPDPEGPSSDYFRSQNAMGGIDPKDMDTAVRTVLAEAGNQGPEGMQAVAAVLRNRAQMAGTTLGQEALKPNQFEPWSPGSGNDPRRFDPASPEYQTAYKTVLPVLTGQGADPTGGATHFYAPKAQAALKRPAPSWDNGSGFDIGDHRFFKLPYGNGGQAAPNQVASLDPSIGAPGGTPAPAGVGIASADAPEGANLQAVIDNPLSPPNQRAWAQKQLQGMGGGSPAAPPAPAPVQVAQAGPAPNPLAAALQGRGASPSPAMSPQQQETIRQLLGNPRTRQAGIALIQQAQERALEAQKLQQQRAWEEQKLLQQRGWQVEDRGANQSFQRQQADTQWNREQPYKDSASSVAQGNLDVSRQRLDLDRNKPMAVGLDQDVINPATGQVIRQGQVKPQNKTVEKLGNRIMVVDPNASSATDVTPAGTPTLDPTKDPAEMRKEIMQLPSYKNYKQAAPVFKGMAETAGRDTKASDLNLIYGLGKIMDPNSVVREGEIQMANDTQGLAQRLNGMINSINGGARLSPESRQAIMQEAYGRMKSYEDEYGIDSQHYRGIATRGGLNVDDIVPGFEPSKPWEPAAPDNGAPVAPGNYRYNPTTRQMERM